MSFLSSLTARFWQIALTVTLACLPLAYCQGRSDGKHAERAKWEAAAAAAKARADKATVTAGQQRAIDTIRNHDLEKARTDAIAQNPNDPRRALNCERLRQAGIDATSAGC